MLNLREKQLQSLSQIFSLHNGNTNVGGGQQDIEE